MAQVPERLIQDAISHGARLQRLLNEQLEKRDWTFNSGQREQPDVVNQEYWLDGGRIDVLATFNNRSRLAIVETKAGFAGRDAVQQLKWYACQERLEKLKKEDLQLKGITHWIGIVIAEDFIDIPRDQYFPACNDTFLVKFDLAAKNAFPFTLVQDVLAAPSKPQRARYQSQLVQFDDHLTRARPKGGEIEQFVKEIAKCFLADNDPRRTWVMVNPKNGHLGIHYKGFDPIRVWTDWTPLTITINGANYSIPKDEERVRAAVLALVNDIDNKMERIIGGFNWTD